MQFALVNCINILEFYCNQTILNVSFESKNAALYTPYNYYVLCDNVIKRVTLSLYKCYNKRKILMRERESTFSDSQRAKMKRKEEREHNG